MSSKKGILKNAKLQKRKYEPLDEEDQFDDDKDEEISTDGSIVEDEETDEKPIKISKNAESGLTNIRQELSSLPLGELLALKDHMPAKLYKKAVYDGLNEEAVGANLSNRYRPDEESMEFGTSTTGTMMETRTEFKEFTVRKSFKRDNRKRPREMSAKRPVSVIREVFSTTKKVSRDPRFDNSTGDFDSDSFRRKYGFLDELRSEEYLALKKEIKTEFDPDRLKKLKLMKQRMENQRRATEEEDRKKKLKKDVRSVNMERLKEGKDPFFVKKSELKRRLRDDRFERLEKEGKLKKYQERREKKLAKKDRAPKA